MLVIVFFIFIMVLDTFLVVVMVLGFGWFSKVSEREEVEVFKSW